MSQAIRLRGSITASIRATRNFLGKLVEGLHVTPIRRDTGQITIDQRRFTFTGESSKEGSIYVDIKTEEIKSFYLNVQNVNAGMIAGGIIMMIAGTIMMFLMFRMMPMPIIVGIPLIIMGIVLLVLGLKRSLLFSIRTTNHLYDFITITVRGFNQHADYKYFIEEFWRVSGQLDDKQDTSSPDAFRLASAEPRDSDSIRERVIQQARERAPRPVERAAASPVPVIAPRERANPPGTMLQVDDTITPESVIMCDVCYEDFNNHEELLAHKKREEHW